MIVQPSIIPAHTHAIKKANQRLSHLQLEPPRRFSSLFRSPSVRLGRPTTILFPQRPYDSTPLSPSYLSPSVLIHSVALWLCAYRVCTTTFFQAISVVSIVYPLSFCLALRDNGGNSSSIPEAAAAINLAATARVTATALALALALVTASTLASVEPAVVLARTLLIV